MLFWTRETWTSSRPLCQMESDANTRFALEWLPLFAMDPPTERERKASFSRVLRRPLLVQWPCYRVLR